ncbi:MAG: hypothetical protein JW797_14985 [Bradymonadales bacterium]|nr:hypothetical protein [Bradymonadales bacterium]
MIGNQGDRMKVAGTRGAKTARWLALSVLLLVWAGAIACMEDFDPPSLVNNLRVLAISTEPAELAPGESVVMEALVVEPEGAPISYLWEWCPFDRGPNERYACVTEELGLPPEVRALFDLGDQPEAQLDYPGDPTLFRQMCESIRSSGFSLPTFIELPDCERGMAVTVRLTVSTPELERIAVRNLFVWFVEPDPEQRNSNPVIEELRVDGNRYRPGSAVLAAPGQVLGVDVVVGESSLEPFVVQLEGDQTQSRREDLIYSYFSTEGEWDRFRSFADLESFSLRDAGTNTLAIPADSSSSTGIDLYVVVRDERGGVAWKNQVVRVVDP